jgi:hypothetical protein
MRKRNPQANLQRIGEILPRVLKKGGFPVRLEDNRLKEIWEKAVGPQIAAHSRPENIKKNLLFVKVASSVWMHQLHFLKEEITGKVNALMGKTSVTDIRFSIGNFSRPQGKEKAPSPTPLSASLLTARDKKMMAECLASLRDEELKIIVKRAMTMEITRRRSRERKAP